MLVDDAPDTESFYSIIIPVSDISETIKSNTF
jgi:hypothetical protein